MSIVYGRRPSNGTEGDFQRAQTCARCTVDHDGGWHGGNEDGDGCPILIDGLVGEHSYPNPDGPPEWGNDLDTGVWVCTAFNGPCPCHAPAVRDSTPSAVRRPDPSWPTLFDTGTQP